MKVLGSGIEHAPEQHPEPLSGQHWILNQLCHRVFPSFLFFTKLQQCGQNRTSFHQRLPVFQVWLADWYHSFMVPAHSRYYEFGHENNPVFWALHFSWWKFIEQMNNKIKTVKFLSIELQLNPHILFICSFYFVMNCELRMPAMYYFAS